MCEMPPSLFVDPLSRPRCSLVKAWVCQTEISGATHSLVTRWEDTMLSYSGCQHKAEAMEQ